MKYYSELTKKIYETKEELEKDELALTLKKEEEEKALTQKKQDAKEVEDAYKQYIEARKKAYKDIDKAEKEYLTKRNEFVKKYGSFHMTYKDTDDADMFGIWDDFLNIFNVFKK